jgi:dTDP-4-dehydrorhamnose 3,5-epimerase
MMTAVSKVIVEKTALDGVLLVTPPTRFEDFRGTYVESYNRELYEAAGIADSFIQDDFSISYRHVLRGIHGDGQTTKLVSCVHGVIFVNIVNNDPDSPQYRKWQSFTLSDKNNLQLYIPPKFGNSFLVMSEFCVYHYKQTTTYDRAGQFTIKWNDPSYGFFWPVGAPILSERDSA